MQEKINNMIGNVYHEDCLETMSRMKDNSVDLVLTDPPYLYLEHKLDKAFNEELFFKECFRILKEDGFLVFFGFGISYHNWNMICYNLGFTHKEDLIWDKGHNSSPFGAIARQHENISIFTKGSATFNDVRVDYLEDRIANNNLTGIETDLDRILGSFKKIKTFEDFEVFKNNKKEDIPKHGITAGVKTSKDRGMCTLETLQNGFKMRSITRVKREHYQMEHPTQKPEKLLEMIMRLTSNKSDIVYDPFSGSGSTLRTAIKINRNYIGSELDKDYYEIILKRLSKVQGALF